jgi:polyisoprenoid-binding protein YceI
MKLFGILASFFISSHVYAASTFVLDTKASSLKWNARKVAGPHNGTVAIKSGSITLEKGMPKSGEFAVDLATITNLDISSAEFRTKLETHLKSEDFFNVAKFPEATLKITGAKAGANGEFACNADLTIKGITKPVTFNAKIKEEGKTAKATAQIIINRLDWDIKYNSGKFFDVKKLGDKMIYDDVTFDLDLVANSK